MANLTKSRRQDKPKKPTKPNPDFPLYAHATGRWAKKIRRKLLYFGPWDDPDAALQKYLDQKDELYAGRTPRNTGDGLTVGELCNRFLTGKKHLLDSSELKLSTFQEYYSVCEKIVRAFQKNRLVDDLATDDFESFRSSLSKGRGPVALGKDVRVTRMAFKYAFDSGLIDKPVLYGPNFKMPSRKILRQARQTNGRRMFESVEELLSIVVFCGIL